MQWGIPKKHAIGRMHQPYCHYMLTTSKKKKKKTKKQTKEKTKKNCDFKRQKHINKPFQKSIEQTTHAPRFQTLSYLAEGIHTERRRLHQMVRRYPLGFSPLEEVLALSDQDSPLSECSPGIFARSGRHAHRLQRAVVADVLGRTRLLQGELSGKGKLGRIQPAISTGDKTADVLINPLEGDLEGQRAVGGCRSCRSIHRSL